MFIPRNVCRERVLSLRNASDGLLIYKGLDGPESCTERSSPSSRLSLLSTMNPATVTMDDAMTSPMVMPHQTIVRDIVKESAKHRGILMKLRRVATHRDHRPWPMDWNMLDVTTPMR